VGIKNLHPPKFCFTKFRRARAKIIRNTIEIRAIFDILFIHILGIDIDFWFAIIIVDSLGWVLAPVQVNFLF